jgi:hypothetical protein
VFRSSRLALTGLFIALAVGLGFGTAAIPNVELLSITVFLGGAATGPLHGLLIGVAAELLFSGLNPIGPAFPLVLVAQLSSVGAIGLAGGLLGVRLSRLKRLTRACALGASGLLLTLLFDALTNLALGVHLGPILPTLIGGLAFGVMHLVSNTVIFAGIGPGGLRVLGDLGLFEDRDGGGGE